MARYAIEMNGARRVVPLNFVLELVRRGDLDLQTRAWRDGEETTVAAVCAEYERASAARQATETATSSPGKSGASADGGWGAGADSSRGSSPMDASPRIEPSRRSSTYATQYDGPGVPQPNASPNRDGKGGALKIVSILGVLAAILGGALLIGIGLIPERSAPDDAETVASDDEGETEEAGEIVVSGDTDDEWDGDLDDPQDVLDALRNGRDSSASDAGASAEGSGEGSNGGVEE